MEHIRLNDDLMAIPELRNRLRKLRWFVSAFRVHTRLVEQETGMRFTIDEGRLNNVFFDWIDTLMSNRRGVEVDLRDFVCFAAGLALGSLVRHAPVNVAGSEDTTHRDADTTELARQIRTRAEVWPAGFLYVNFCLSVIAALEEQEFGRIISSVDDQASDNLFWGSLYENVSADSRLGVPYLDMILGKKPNFDDPVQVLYRPAMQKALGVAKTPKDS